MPRLCRMAGTASSQASEQLSPIHLNQIRSRGLRLSTMPGGSANSAVAPGKAKTQVGPRLRPGAPWSPGATMAGRRSPEGGDRSCTTSGPAPKSGRSSAASACPAPFRTRRGAFRAHAGRRSTSTRSCRAFSPVAYRCSVMPARCPRRLAAGICDSRSAAPPSGLPTTPLSTGAPAASRPAGAPSRPRPAAPSSSSAPSACMSHRTPNSPPNGSAP
jgi:hypothetical protein